LLAFFIVITAIVWGIKFKRNNEQENQITFREAFCTGMVITIIMALITSSFMYAYIHVNYVNHKETARIIDHVKENRNEDAPPFSSQVIQEYYVPSHRALHTGEDIILIGFLVSLFSAGMFRRLHPDDLDLVKKTVLPSMVNKLFLISIMLAMLPILVYIALILKIENISKLPFDFLVEPINDGILQVGTALFSLAALFINIIIYNRIALYSNRRRRWSILMIVVCGALFFISLWPVL
jgi:hypothetical protein